MKKKFIYAVLLGTTLLMIINPQKSVEYARNGLNLCGNIIIPSLFPFFICSGLLVGSGFCEIPARLMQPVMKPLFNINGAGSAAFILGIISGYPLGAITACHLYEKSYISKSEAERLLAFCNNSGPLFILGAVGISLYHNPTIGIILYSAHIISAIITGIIFKFYKKNDYCAPNSALLVNSFEGSGIFSNALSSSIQSILTVCGAVIFFSVISNAALDLLPGSQNIKPYTIGLFEFVTGVNSISESSLPLLEKLTISAGIVGFAGMSVHIQVMSIVSRYGLSLKPYLLGKTIHGILAMIFTLLILKLYPGSLPVFAPQTLEVSGAFAMNSLFILMSVTSSVFIALAAVITWGFKKHIGHPKNG